MKDAPEAPIHDVILVGYGPVSQALALMLGRQGRDVLVSERWDKRYPLPRAVCIDHELYRVLCANGMAGILPQISHPGPLYQWFNSEWQELLSIDWSAPSISGGSEVNFVHQPTLEEALDDCVTQQPTVTTLLGWETVAIRQTKDFVEADLVHLASGDTRTALSRFLVGCDGANSIVRSAIDCDREDRGFEADWLVVDVLLKPGVTVENLGIPPAGQYCNPARPTTIVPAGIREGCIFRRWEFMRLPGEAVEELECEERVWELLQPWVGPEEVELVRHKIYNFRSLLAQQWRDGRILIAGDAAHVMPPFMGQGMCSGLRDASNLAWRLGLILPGVASSALLDGYQTERLPHVAQIIDLSIFLGKIICIPDPAAAAARDDEFLSGRAPLPPPFPQLTAGLIRRDEAGRPLRGSGQLSPHTTVAGAGFEGRLDDLTGHGFVLAALGLDPAQSINRRQRAALARLGIAYVGFDAGTPQSLRDCDGKITDFLEQLGWCAMLIRPDFYIYGGAIARPDIAVLVEDFLRDIEASETVNASVQT